MMFALYRIPPGLATTLTHSRIAPTLMTSRRTFLAASAALALAAHPLSALTPQPVPRSPRFGVNYTPRKGWWFCWLDWDAHAIAEDLHAIAALGFDHIRIQCLWPFFQPGISYISETILAHTVQLLDLADRAGLDVEVTVLNGWMSGIAYMPAWLLPPRQQRNIFTNPDVIAAERLLFQRLAQAVATHKRFLGFDIGNEIGLLLGVNPAPTPTLDAWSADLLKLCETIAPNKFHVNGVDHEHWFNDFGFSRPALASQGHATVVHSYVYFSHALEKYGPTGVGTLHLAEYQVEVAYAYQTDLDRPVWIEEIGVSPSWIPDEHMSAFVDHTVRNAIGTGKTWGITWWCSHDIDRSISGFADLEYTLGLIGLDNKPKPIGKQIAALAAELRGHQPAKNDRTLALVIPDTGLPNKQSPADWTFAKPFMTLIAQGKRPCIVIESRANDQPYLDARGVKQLIRLSDIAT